MTNENPYAPPTVSEPESVLICKGDGWKLLGDILLVRIGVTLPKVDLETGFSDASLKPCRQPHSLFRSDKSFWSFADPRRSYFFKLRHVIREVLFYGLLFLIIFTPTINLPTFISSHLEPFQMPFILICYFLWGWLDRPKLKFEDSVTPGWLRVTNLHPAALTYLREIADKKDLRYYPQSQ